MLTNRNLYINIYIGLESPGQANLYEEFYEEINDVVITENSMNVIFFGPIEEFLRIDVESILHILTITLRWKIPISRVLLIWDLITGTYN